MKRISVITALLLALAIPAGVSAEGGTSSGFIAKGTKWQTPYYIVDSGTKGPTVLVTAGMHGDEPAGARAAEQIRHWPLAKGKLIVIPRCNVPALEAGTRRTPDKPKEISDLNRNFPLSGKANTARSPAAEALWTFIRKQKGDYTIDLHEGYGFRAAGSKSVGSSVIRAGHEDPAKLQALMLDAINATISDADKKFARLRGAADGSLARACSERLTSRAFMLETTFKDQPLALRTRQHRIMVHALLKKLGMTAADKNRMVPGTRRTPTTIYAAIYDGPGSNSTKTPPRFEKILTPQTNIVVRRVDPQDIRDGALDQFDTVILPGGSGSGQAKGLAETGREAMKKFIRNGGGYVGICAGAYLATGNYSWSLGILNADSIDRKHWRRGKGQVSIELTRRGRELLATREAGLLKIHFAQGPILAPGGKEALPPYTVLGWYRTGIGEKGADPKTMIGTPAIVIGRFGKGRVIVFGPHPEQTDGLHGFILRAIRWTARQDSPPRPQVPRPQKPGITAGASLSCPG